MPNNGLDSLRLKLEQFQGFRDAAVEELRLAGQSDDLTAEVLRLGEIIKDLSETIFRWEKCYGRTCPCCGRKVSVGRGGRKNGGEEKADDKGGFGRC